MKRLTQQNGFLLLTTFAALILLIILSAAIFAKSVHENTTMKRNLGKLSAKYYAEKGFECAYYEILRHGSQWQTHYLNAEQSPGDPLLLLNEDIVDPLDVKLSHIAEHDPAEGYKALNGRFLVKVYMDPVDHQLIILSRGTSEDGNYTYLLAAKVAAASLYEYFRFTPYKWAVSSTTYQASGAKMHTNDELLFQNNARFYEIAELSAGKHISYSHGAFVPPPGSPRYDAHGIDVSHETPTWEEIYWNRRPPFVSAQPLDRNQHYNRNDGSLAGGMQYKLYMYNDGSNPDYPAYNPEDPPAPTTNQIYVPCEGEFNNCYLPEANEVLAHGHPEHLINQKLYTVQNYYIYGEDADETVLHHQHAKIKPYIGDREGEDIQIPNMLNQQWDYDLFNLSSNGQWTPNGTVYYPNPQSGSVTVPTKALHSTEQKAAWESWLNDNSLYNILKDKNTGAEHITPIRINNRTYVDQAINHGMYIRTVNLSSGECAEHYGEDEIPVIQRGAEIICPEENGTYQYGGQAIAERYSFIDVRTVREEHMVKLDLEALGTVDAWPGNGIIYSEYNVGLDNAEILAEPLTTVSKENCYLFGNYNSDSEEAWKPSAVITAKHPYTFSETFIEQMERLRTEAPNGLPNFLNNPNTPYAADGYYTTLPCHEDQGGDGCTGGTGPEADYWDGDDNDATHWQHEMANTMTPEVTSDHEYYVSIVSYLGNPPILLEDWRNFERQMVGSFVTLEADNFRHRHPDNTWHYTNFRFCNDEEFAEAYPEAVAQHKCRGAERGGSWTYMKPHPDRNIFRYEDRYDITDPEKVPPGELPGYFESIRLTVPDSEHYFNHHAPELSPSAS
ncbi:hypothetical protein ACFL1E_01140 [Candidatus Omnitrophota bacterium]